MILKKEFYNRDTIQVAKDLLGTFLVHKSKEGICVGKIVETEAYLASDPASHSFGGMTKRNAPMFGPPGRAYIYFIYGMYHCFNVVTREKGSGEAVLIRSLEPVEGIPLMIKRRSNEKITSLCSGPGKLVIAMGIPSSCNGIILTKPPLYILSRDHYHNHHTVHVPFETRQTPRIGITKGSDMHLRFSIRNNEFVSQNKKEEK